MIFHDATEIEREGAASQVCTRYSRVVNNRLRRELPFPISTAKQTDGYS